MIGKLSSTASYQVILRKGVSLAEKRLITEKILSTLFEPNVAINEKTKMSYGLGWILQDSPMGKLVWHGGNITGFSSIVVTIPEHDLGVVVLSNQQASALPNKLAMGIIKFVLTPREPTEQNLGYFLDLDSQMRSVDLALDNFSLFRPLDASICSHEIPEGVFRRPGYGDLVVTRVGEQLYFKYYAIEGEIRKTPEGFVLLSPVGSEDGVLLATRCVGGKLSLGMPFEPEVGSIWFERALVM
jgi:CubicO group peptidase (beta-lactamase class C family)